MVTLLNLTPPPHLSPNLPNILYSEVIAQKWVVRYDVKLDLEACWQQELFVKWQRLERGGLPLTLCMIIVAMDIVYYEKVYGRT